MRTLLQAGKERPWQRELTPEEQAEIRFAFDLLDRDGAGQVRAAQLKVALRALGFPVKKSEVRELLQGHGQSENGPLDFRQFHDIIASKLTERTFVEEMRRAFQLFDLSGTGSIDLHNLSTICQQLGLALPLEQLKEMIQEFDQDGDGKVNEQEFAAIMTDYG